MLQASCWKKDILFLIAAFQSLKEIKDRKQHAISQHQTLPSILIWSSMNWHEHGNQPPGCGETHNYDWMKWQKKTIILNTMKLSVAFSPNSVRWFFAQWNSSRPEATSDFPPGWFLYPCHRWCMPGRKRGGTLDTTLQRTACWMEDLSLDLLATS